MSEKVKRAAVILLAALLAVGPIPVAAAGPIASAAQAEPLLLPPLPEWPIIGPLLLRLGVIDEPVHTAPEPDPSLPEYRISNLGDLDQLESVEAGKRIRVIVSEGDANRMAQELLASQAGDEASFSVDFAPLVASVAMTIDASAVRRLGINLPAIVRGNLSAITEFGADGANCFPIVDFQRLSVNGWSIGLLGFAQRLVDDRIAEIWPAEICVERILLMDGEAAVEGYRVP
jgi:hypothetical protein